MKEEARRTTNFAKLLNSNRFSTKIIFESLIEYFFLLKLSSIFDNFKISNKANSLCHLTTKFRPSFKTKKQQQKK